jgi:hypothetical protein
MKKLIFAILTVLWLSNTADAGVFFNRSGRFLRSGPCSNSCPVSPVTYKYESVPIYHDQVVVAPIIQTFLIPAYQFQYVQPCATQQPTMGQPVMEPNNVMSTLPNQNDKIKELAKALIEEMSRQSSEGVNDDGPPMAQGPMAQGFNAPSPSNQSNLGMIALAKNCSACHTGTASKGEMMIFSQPGVLNPNVSWGSIREVIKTAKMPPKDAQFRLSIDEATAIINLANNFGRIN